MRCTRGPRRARPSRSSSVANSEPAIRRCGRLGDGWYPWTISPDDFAAGVQLLVDTARDAGRSPHEIELTVAPGSANPAGEMDIDWVRRYVDAGASTLALRLPLQTPADLAAVPDNLASYRDDVLARL